RDRPPQRRSPAEDVARRPLLRRLGHPARARLVGSLARTLPVRSIVGGAVPARRDQPGVRGGRLGGTRGPGTPGDYHRLIVIDLDRIPTEQVNPRTADLDRLGTLELLERLNDEDARVAGAVRRSLPSVARAVDLAVERWQRGGRVLQFGAGTSGRLA